MSIVDREFFNREPVLKVEEVKLSDDVVACIRELTNSEYEKVHKNAIKSVEGEDDSIDSSLFNNSMVACCLCDADGNNFLNSDDHELVRTRFKRTDLVKLIFAAQELNGLNLTAEDLTGN